MLKTAKLEYLDVDDKLTRRAGLFWRQSIDLSKVKRIVATSDDSVTHEEIHVFFEADDGSELVVSEFDQDFSTVAIDLEKKFPGFGQWSELNKGEAFQFRKIVLWERQSDGTKGPE